ncbi:MAG: hypothetical protein L6R41_004318 [Letrouitia leprolyta]|nr:MAG: hypothetical protein L6R41_004318 [Letrouitia leprolyta]
MEWIYRREDLAALARDSEHGWFNGFVKDGLHMISRKMTMFFFRDQYRTETSSIQVTLLYQKRFEVFLRTVFVVLTTVLFLVPVFILLRLQPSYQEEVSVLYKYDDLAPGTTLTFANPYLGIQYAGFTVRDFTGNGVLTVPSGPNALIAINPYIPANRVTLTVNRPEIRILDPESAFLACVFMDKATKKIEAAVECYVQVVGTGPNYYIVEDVWHFIPDSKKKSNLDLFNLGDNFNSINTIELRLLNTTTSKLKKSQVNAIVFDEFIYGGRLN